MAGLWNLYSKAVGGALCELKPGMNQENKKWLDLRAASTGGPESVVLKLLYHLPPPEGSGDLAEDGSSYTDSIIHSSSMLTDSPFRWWITHSLGPIRTDSARWVQSGGGWRAWRVAVYWKQTHVQYHFEAIPQRIDFFVTSMTAIKCLGMCLWCDWLCDMFSGVFH